MSEDATNGLEDSVGKTSPTQRPRLSAASFLCRLATGPLVALIWLYRITLSPLVGGQCRYYPSCSQYGLDALRAHGPIRGSWLTMCRLVRCHPFVKGGYDPVPPAAAPRARHAAEPTVPPSATPPAAPLPADRATGG
jgi:uncharacterized protein